MLPALHSILGRLRLKHLGLLIAIDEAGSLHRAAERMAMTQPAATKALHEIESILGAALFERSARGLAATELGHCAIRHARLMHSGVEQLREEMLGILGGRGGRLAVGAIMGAIPAVLPRALARLHDEQPAISVEIVEDTSAQLLRRLADGQLDVILGRASVSDTPEAFDWEALHDEPLSVAAHPAHRHARAQRLALAELCEDRWILYPRDMPLRRVVEREFAQAGLALPRHTVETASTFASLSMLQQRADSVALLPTSVASFVATHGMACLLPVELAARTEPFGLVTRRGTALSPAAQLFARLLREQSVRGSGPGLA